MTTVPNSNSAASTEIEMRAAGGMFLKLSTSEGESERPRAILALFAAVLVALDGGKKGALMIFKFE